MEHQIGAFLQCAPILLLQHGKSLTIDLVESNVLKMHFLNVLMKRGKKRFFLLKGGEGELNEFIVWSCSPRFLHQLQLRVCKMRPAFHEFVKIIAYTGHTATHQGLQWYKE